MPRRKKPRSATPLANKVRRAKAIVKGPSEDEIHMAVVAKLRAAGLGPTDFWHTPNGGKCSKAEGVRRKARGVHAGVVDLVFTLPPPLWGGAPGAALELKRPGEKPTDAQREFLAVHKARGWATDWTDNERDALAILENWGYL